VCYSRPKVYAYVPNFVSIGLFCRPLLAKNAIFCSFWTLGFSGVAKWQQSEKVEHGYTTTNLPISNGIKIVSVLQRRHGEIRRTISDFKSVMDRHTNKQSDRQTKKLNVSGHPGGGWNPSSTKLGMVIEDLKYVLTPVKLLGVWSTVLPLEGAENLGITRPRQFKIPITP